MTGVLQLLALVVIACLATFFLERGGRVGYGWITGSEFLVGGLLVGPVGLDLVSADLLVESNVLVVLAASWVGLRFGLRLRRGLLARVGLRRLLSSQLEPVLSLLALRALLEPTRTALGFPASNWAAWLFAAIGAATTKSAVAWVKSRHRASGPLSDALGAIGELDDLPTVLGAGFLFAYARPAQAGLPPKLWAPLAVTVGLSLALAVLVRLVSGKKFRADLAWVALCGACALAAGASQALGGSPVVVCSLAGVLLGWLSPQADAFEELTRPTERPVVQVLLLLAGASLRAVPAELFAGLVFGGARLLAKLAGGAVIGVALRPSGRVQPALGAGLLGGGGVAFALAFSASLTLPESTGGPLLAGAAAMVLLGDLVGSPLLKGLLRAAGEVPAQGLAPAATVAEGSP